MNIGDPQHQGAGLPPDRLHHQQRHCGTAVRAQSRVSRLRPRSDPARRRTLAIRIGVQLDLRCPTYRDGAAGNVQSGHHSGNSHARGIFPEELRQCDKTDERRHIFRESSAGIRSSRLECDIGERPERFVQQQSHCQQPGTIVLLNPNPGQIGSLGLNYIEGPRSLGLDMNLIKRVHIDESKDFEFRIVATNVLNHPIFGSPNLNINSPTFGRITNPKTAEKNLFCRSL